MRPGHCMPLGSRAKAALAAAIFLCQATTQRAAAHVTASSAFIMPVTPACVSSGFGPRVLPGRPLAGIFHTGIDLPAPVGAAVTAVGPGTIIRIQRRGVGGLEMLVQHEGFVGVYSHLGSITPMIAEGRKFIYGGERLATVGTTGVSYGPHLYFGMIVDGQSVDPAPYLKLSACGSRMLLPQDPRLPPTRLFAQRQSLIAR